MILPEDKRTVEAKKDDAERDGEESCPVCGGDVACDADGNWTCIAVTDGLLGCGWHDPEVKA